MHFSLFCFSACVFPNLVPLNLFGLWWNPFFCQQLTQEYTNDCWKKEDVLQYESNAKVFLLFLSIAPDVCDKNNIYFSTLCLSPQLMNQRLLLKWHLMNSKVFQLCFCTIWINGVSLVLILVWPHLENKYRHS